MTDWQQIATRIADKVSISLRTGQPLEMQLGRQPTKEEQQHTRKWLKHLTTTRPGGGETWDGFKA